MIFGRVLDPTSMAVAHEQPRGACLGLARDNVVIGVLGGTLVTELTVDGRIVWATFYEAVSFWALVVAVGLVGVFSVAAINHTREISDPELAGCRISYVGSTPGSTSVVRTSGRTSDEASFAAEHAARRPRRSPYSSTLKLRMRR